MSKTPEKTLIKRLSDASFVRFLGVGVINTLIGLSLNFLLYNFVFWPLGHDPRYWLATGISNAIGAVASFFLNRKFTFRNKTLILKTLPRFILVIAACYLIAYKFAQDFLQWAVLQINLQISERVLGNVMVLFGMGLYTILNYFGQKLFVFGQPKGETDESSN